VGTTRLRRPPAPTGAERARSVAARTCSPAALVGTGTPITRPLTQHVRADGSAVLVLAGDEPLLERLDAEPSAMLELADPAPVDLREPVRGLLWITGRLAVVAPGRARRIAIGLAERRPDTALLEIGHGAVMVRLTAHSVVLSDAEGTAALAPLDLAAALPDPFCHHEHRWLRHLEERHPEVFPALARHLPTALRDARGLRVRPLGVDRCGLRLRVEHAEADHDVRIAWEGPIATLDELRVQFHRLVGCPVRRTA
jgi:hypothetical protein